jgi:flagellar FliL protein
MAKKPKDKAEDVPQDGADGADAAAAKKKKLIIFGAAGLVAVLALGGGGAWYFGLLGGTAADASAEATMAPPKTGVFVDLPDMTVNLSSTESRATYLKVKISLEVANQSVADKIQPAMPRVLDAFQVYLRELRTTDLDGSAGIYRLKEELARRVNVAIHPARVDAVLFKEILVQ